MTKVLLFGMSGNPPTGRDGHSGMVEYFVSLGQFDELWILPVYKHMFSYKRKAMAEAGAPTFDDRINMCRLAFERYATVACKVKVLRTEEEVFTKMLKAQESRKWRPSWPKSKSSKEAAQLRSSTYDVLRFLQNRHTNVEFSFLVGTDTYQDVLKGKWRKCEELMKMTTFVIVDRLGVRNETEDLLTGVETHHPPMLTDISSTKIRNASARELLEGTLAVEYSVLQYMREHRLYGFGRQWRIDRTFMDASEYVSDRKLLFAGAVGLLLAVGLGTAIATERRAGRGGWTGWVVIGAGRSGNSIYNFLENMF